MDDADQIRQKGNKIELASIYKKKRQDKPNWGEMNLLTEK